MSRPPGRDARRSAASAAHEIVDPAEPWETPLPRAAAARLDPQAEAARPTRPSSEADLPPGVLRVLRFTCGSLPLERTLLFPPAVRPIDRSCRRFVTTPRQVLGLGERAMLGLYPAPDVDVGLGPGQQARASEPVEGGMLGLVVDARGRPLELPSEPQVRMAKISHWRKSLGIEGLTT